MQEKSFLPSDEPQEQHQGEGAQGILWRNLLSSISQPLLINYGNFLQASPIFDYFKLCRRDISLQPLADPWEQHPGEARQRI